MSSQPVSRRRCARTAVTPAGLLVVLLLAFGAIVLSAASAAAHESLIGSDPVDGSAPAEAPRSVRLTFSESVQKRYASIAVTDPAGRRVESGTPNVAGAVMSVSLQPLTVAGRYTVGWRVVSADGHPVTGDLHFSLSEAVAAAERDPAGPGPPATATGSAALPRPAAASSGSAADGNFVTDHAGHFLIGGVVVLIGVVLLWRERRMAR